VKPVFLRRDPVDAEAVWAVPSGRRARAQWRYLGLTVCLLAPMTVTAALGTISFSAPDGTAIASFWPAAAFQVVFSIWFGVYGALAGIIGPMLGNALVGGSPFLFIPANAIQSCLAGLWFRYSRLDPRLRGSRDWFGALVVGCALANALGAMAGVAEGHLRDLASSDPVGDTDFWAVKLLTWFAGNGLPCLILVPALLKTVSPAVVRGPMFCQRFWGGVEVRHHRRGAPFRFDDLPMVGKLMLLAAVAGILPLLVVAAWAVWGTMEAADRVAMEMTRRAVHEIRNEAERHEMLLRYWAAELDRPGLEAQEREALLNKWRSEPDGFRELDIIDLSVVGPKMWPGAWKALREDSVAFYRTGGVGPDGEPEVWGVFRLDSAPDQALTGLVDWRRPPLPARTKPEDIAVLVLDDEGNELYGHRPVELADWHPEETYREPRTNPGRRGPAEQAGLLQVLARRSEGTRTIRHGGRTWHVAESELPRMGWRFLAVTSARAGQAMGLARFPNPVAALLNLAIFGSIIAGSAMAQRISGRVLAMAERLREAGPNPGRLRLPVRGRDELGYLAQTLNEVSGQLEESVRRLQETTAEKERLAAEMELARQVQQSILPARPPEVPGYELAASIMPAREVGGDFYDFFARADGRTVIMIGDAVGKGLRAAMFITETRTLAHAAALERSTPERILQAVNAALVSTRGPSVDFVTMLCAVLEPERHRLLYASAGHNPPIWVHHGEAERLGLGGLPLAIATENDCPLREVILDPGDTVLFYTDGATDAANAEQELFGMERLMALARRHADQPPAQLVDALLQAINEFAAGMPQSDDITLLALRRSE